MEKAKPIEPGCLAITINCHNPKNNNKVVHVLRFVGEVPGWTGDSRWATDMLFSSAYSDNKTNAIREEVLLRIDDPDIQTEIDRERVLEHV